MKTTIDFALWVAFSLVLWFLLRDDGALAEALYAKDLAWSNDR